MELDLPAPPPAVTPADHGSLHRNLGVGSIVFMVVAFAAPLGVVVANFPIILTTSGTVAAPLYIIVAGALLVIFSVGFTRMSRRISNAGAFYTYIMRGLGRRAGLGAAMLALASYLCLLIGVGTYVGVAASDALSRFAHVDLSWWILALIGLVVVGFLGYRDIDLSAKVLGVLLVAEILAVAIFDVAILVKGGPGDYAPHAFSPATAMDGAPGLGLLFSFLGFFGFEATAVFRNEARDPAHTIPRATYVAVISIGVFYALSSWATVVGLGPSKAVDAAGSDPANVMTDLGTRFAGAFIGDAMQILLVTSMFACVLSIHNALTRYAFTLSSQGVLGSGMGVVHPTHRSPSRASMVVTLVSLAGMVVVTAIGLDPVAQIYAWFTGAATIGIIALMAVTSVSVVVHFRRVPDPSSGLFAVTIAPVIAALGLIGVLVLAIKNLPLLVGTSTAADIVLAALVVIIAAGVTTAFRLRRRRPDQYIALLTEIEAA